MERNEEIGSRRFAHKGRWSREHGRGVVAAWRRSGATLAEFAKAEGISVDRLRYWRDQLALQSRRGKRNEPGVGARVDRPVSLLPVVVRGDAALPACVGMTSEASSSGDEAVGGIDPVWLGRLLRALVFAEAQR